MSDRDKMTDAQWEAVLNAQCPPPSFDTPADKRRYTDEQKQAQHAKIDALIQAAQIAARRAKDPRP